MDPDLKRLETRVGFLLAYRPMTPGYRCIVDLEGDLSKPRRYVVRSGRECEIKKLLSEFQLAAFLMPRPCATREDIKSRKERFLDLDGCTWVAGRSQEFGPRQHRAHTYVLAKLESPTCTHNYEWWTSGQFKHIIGRARAETDLSVAISKTLAVQGSIPRYLELFPRPRALAQNSVDPVNAGNSVIQIDLVRQISEVSISEASPILYASPERDFIPSLWSLLAIFPEIRKLIVSHLSATYASLVLALCGIEITDVERRDYLYPLKDFGKYADWIEEKKQAGCRIVLIGRDLELLQHRIQHPLESWGKEPRKMYVWICAVSRERLVIPLTSHTCLGFDENWKVVPRFMTEVEEGLHREEKYTETSFIIPPTSELVKLSSSENWSESELDQGRSTWYEGREVIETGVVPLFYTGLERIGDATAARLIPGIVPSRGPIHFTEAFRAGLEPHVEAYSTLFEFYQFQRWGGETISQNPMRYKVFDTKTAIWVQPAPETSIQRKTNGPYGYSDWLKSNSLGVSIRMATAHPHCNSSDIFLPLGVSLKGWLKSWFEALDPCDALQEELTNSLDLSSVAWINGAIDDGNIYDRRFG